MNRLSTAMDRLDRAIARLEAAVEDGEPTNELRAELAQARRDYAELSKVTEEVNTRLDHAIGRLKFVLES